MPAIVGVKKMDESTTPLEFFGIIIMTCRVKQGITRDELASKANISLASLSNIECGSAALKETTLAMPYIASALRITPRTLSKVFWVMGF